MSENKEVKGSRKDAFEADNNQWLTSCDAKKGQKQKGRKEKTQTKNSKYHKKQKKKKNRNQKLNSYSNQNIKDTKEELLLNIMKDIQHT